MAELARFFDSVDGDRVYNAQSLADLYERIATEGVIRVSDNSLKVVASSPTAMSVRVTAGAGWVQGRLYANTTAFTSLSAPAAHSTLDRIDRVVLRLDLTERTMSLVYRSGTAAASPAAPALTQTASVWEIGLARIAVAHGSVLIASGAITDERDFSNVFGQGENGVQARGSASGYVGGEFNVPAGEAAFTSSATGGIPVMLFDHRGAAGDWYWRNGVGAVTDRMHLSKDGDLTVTGFVTVGTNMEVEGATTFHGNVAIEGDLLGVDVNGSATFEDATFSLEAEFDAGIDLQGSAHGYSGGELHVPSGNAALSSGAAGTPYMFFDHRGGSGHWWWRNGSGASATRMHLDGDGVLAAMGPNHYFGVGASGVSGVALNIYADAGDSDVWLRAIDNVGSYGHDMNFRAESFTFYDADDASSMARFVSSDDLTASRTSMFLAWRDEFGTLRAMSEVLAVATADGTARRYLCVMAV